MYKPTSARVLHVSSLARITCSQYSGQGISARKLYQCLWFLFIGNNKLMFGQIVYIPLGSSFGMGGPSPLELAYFIFHDS